MKRGSEPSIAIIGSRGYPSFYGGFETAVRHLAPALADDGWQVTVYSRRDAISTVFPGDPRVRSISTPGIESKSLSTLTYGLTATLHAAVTRPDVALVVNVANGFWLPLLRLAGVKSMINVDGIEWERAKWSGLGKRVFRWGAKMTALFGDRLIFDAVAIGDYWQEHFGRRGSFIPYGSERSPRTEPGDHRVIPRPYVLLVARLVPENSIAEFLDAAPQLVDQLDLDVVVVGSAPEGDPLDLQLKALESSPRVHALGHVSDDELLHRLWSQSEVYFHGHTVGGTNPALVQAMALGAATVARDTVYNREVLDDAGVFCSGEPASIVSAVAEARSERTTLAQRAMARAATIYTWDAVCRAYSETAKRLRSG